MPRSRYAASITLYDVRSVVCDEASGMVNVSVSCWLLGISSAGSAGIEAISVGGGGECSPSASSSSSPSRCVGCRGDFNSLFDRLIRLPRTRAPEANQKTLFFQMNLNCQDTNVFFSGLTLFSSVYLRFQKRVELCEVFLNACWLISFRARGRARAHTRLIDPFCSCPKQIYDEETDQLN